MTERKLESWGDVRLRIAPDVASREFHGETVIVDLKGGQYYGLDGVGAVLWELLQHGATLPELVAGVTRQFAVDEATCRSDVLQLLDQLSTARLIETESASV